MNHIKLIQKMWGSLYDKNLNVRDAFYEYFHENYSQCINGLTLNRDDYIQHVIEQRKEVDVYEINYTHLMEKDNEAFALYSIKASNQKNELIKAEVIAYSLFEKDKIINVHGQVHLSSGDLSDIDMS